MLQNLLHLMYMKIHAYFFSYVHFMQLYFFLWKHFAVTFHWTQASYLWRVIIWLLHTWVPVNINKNRFAAAFITRKTWFALVKTVTHKGKLNCKCLAWHFAKLPKCRKSYIVRIILGMLQTKKKNTIKISIRANLASFLWWLDT